MRQFIIRKLLPLCAPAILKFSNAVDVATAEYQLTLVSRRGKNCRFEGRGILHDPEKLFLGDDVNIGRNFFIRATAGIEIGASTHISRNVTIHTVNHNIDGELLPYDRTEVLAPISIGSFVWIGMNVNILPGVQIGDGAVVGMGTTVSKSVPAGSVVVGARQRIVGQRNSDRTRALIESGRFLRKDC